MTKIILASLGRIRIVTVALFALVIVASTMLPVYTDEVGWRLQERAGFDGIDKLYADYCGANTLVRPPAFMMPVRFYSAFFNGAFASPLFVRLSGVGYALFWALLLFLLIRRLTSGMWREMLTIFGFGLLGLGVLPLLLVWSRPDQAVVLTFTAALLIAFWRPSGQLASGQITAVPHGAESLGEWLKPIAILLLGLIALSYHFKALLLIPAFIGAILFAGKSRAWLPRALPSLVLLVAAWVAKNYWFGRLACPGDPVLQAQHAAQNLGLQLHSVLQQQGVARAGLLMLKNLDLTVYARLAGPMEDPMSHWVPADKVTHTGELVWHMLMAMAWLIGLMLAGRSFIVAGIQGYRARRIDPKLIMALLILIGVFAWCASQLIRNVYEASFELPLMMLASLFALSAERDPRPSEPIIWLIGLLAIVMPLSIAAIAFTYGPSLVRSAHAEAYIDDQPYSVPLFHYGKDRDAILATARLCKIRPREGPGKLMIDDLTYFAFMQNRLPQHYLSLLAPPSRGAMTDPAAYLRGIGSGGAILGCHLLPPDLLKRAKRNGEFCCLEAGDL